MAGARAARHRRPEPGDADAVDLKALIAEYSQVAGGRRHRRAAVEDPPAEAPPRPQAPPPPPLDATTTAQIAVIDEPVAEAPVTAPVRKPADQPADKRAGERRPKPRPTARPPARTSARAPAKPTAEPGTKSRAGRNLPAAIGVGVGAGAVILASLFAYRPSFVAIVVVAVGYGIYELVAAIRTVEARPPIVLLLVGGVAMDVAAWYRGPGGLMIALLVTVSGVAIWRLADGASGYLRDVSASVFVLVYLPLLAGFAVLLAHPDDGAARVLAFVGTVVCSDTGGYAAGVMFGKHPLAPVVSKGKTWEGFVGSVIACCLCGSLIMMFTFHEAWWKGALFGLAIVTTATLGDLGESMIKRDLGLKDMGKLLPGHGGIMDRLDSLLPCAAVAYLVLAAFVG
ncbi:MAG TPA: phosphatidate cytidylyltransferase [Jatrophihabitantaceae bacterium]